MDQKTEGKTEADLAAEDLQLFTLLLAYCAYPNWVKLDPETQIPIAAAIGLTAEGLARGQARFNQMLAAMTGAGTAALDAARAKLH